MNPHKFVLFLIIIFFASTDVVSQKRKAPPGGRVAVVVDERLAALRSTPQLDGRLVRRLGRGRLVAIRASKRTNTGVVFLLVNISTRTHGWIQREAVAIPSNVQDEERLLSLIRNSSGFECIARARIFLEYFPGSLKRAQVLLLLGDTAESLSTELSQAASRRVSTEESYFMNYSGLDRYNRLGVVFVFDRESKRLRYNGAAWREIIRRHPRTAEATQARHRLEHLKTRLSSASPR